MSWTRWQLRLQLLSSLQTTPSPKILRSFPIIVFWSGEQSNSVEGLCLLIMELKRETFRLGQSPYHYISASIVLLPTSTMRTVSNCLKYVPMFEIGSSVVREDPSRIQILCLYHIYFNKIFFIKEGVLSKSVTLAAVCLSPLYSFLHNI